MKRFLSLAALAAAGVAAWWYFIADAGRSFVNSPPREGAVVAFGDSLTYGTGSGAGKSYPEHLAEMLGRPVLNYGVPGDTVADALPRLGRVLEADPAVVIVGLGGNDLLQMKNPDESFRLLREIVERCQEAGAMVVLVGVEGMPLVSGNFGDRYEALARETGSVFVPDILDGLFGRKEYMADQIHPNSDGYRIMAERIAKALRPHLN